jgi:hypothetical protein
MKRERPIRIGMIGMYGGMWREFNPGCFLIAHKTKQELQSRIPLARIDISSIDNKSQSDLPKNVAIGGLDLSFFGSNEQQDFLDSTIDTHDALVMGGDIIWGGDDVVQDNDIFFVNSPKFLANSKPVVLFNSVHTFYDDNSIYSQREKFRRAHERASYTAVRTPAVRDRLERLGLEEVAYTPDPVLDLDINTLPKADAFLPTDRDKPLLGISVRKKLAKDLIKTLKQVDTSAYNVVVLPFSRQYDNMGALEEIKKAFGGTFSYFDRYLDPVQTYQLVGELDIFLNDTYHGNIASIIHRKPFISLDVEPELTSRKQQLFEVTGLDQRYNIRLALDASGNIAKLVNELPGLLTSPLSYSKKSLDDVHSRVQRHFDVMSDTILNAMAKNDALV